MRRIPLVLLTVAALASTAATAARDDKGSKTGCFEVRTTLVELLGEEGAKNFSESLELDKRMSWQLYVPPAYSAEDPPGIIVFVSANRRGAGDGADPDGDYCAARPARCNSLAVNGRFHLEQSGRFDTAPLNPGI